MATCPLTPAQQALSVLIEHRLANLPAFTTPLFPSHLLILALQDLGFEASGMQGACAATDPSGWETQLHLSILRVDGEAFDEKGHCGLEAITHYWVDTIWGSLGYKSQSAMEWREYPYDLGASASSKTALTLEEMQQVSSRLAQGARADIQSTQMHAQTPPPGHHRPSRRI